MLDILHLIKYSYKTKWKLSKNFAKNRKCIINYKKVYGEINELNKYLNK